MKDKSNYEITENDIELEKLCADSVELINYARNMIVNHVKYSADNDLLFIR